MTGQEADLPRRLLIEADKDPIEERESLLREAATALSRVRADALEEAAQFLERMKGEGEDDRYGYAADIRALKDKP